MCIYIYYHILLLIIPHGRINSRMTSYLKIFVLIDFHFQDAIFPFNRARAMRHDERGSEGAKPNERGGAPDIPSLSTLARTPPLPRERSEVSGALRDGAKDLARRKFQLPFNATRSKISGATGRTNLKIFPSGVFTAA